jgi:methionyl-tRNA formyltransferase
MKFAFCTCVQIGLSCIQAALDSGHQFDLLITLHDHKARKKSGRVYLDEIASAHKIPLLKINHINDPEVREMLVSMGIDWLFIIGWSQIASTDVIESCNKGVIGAHPTLLPQGRGRAAIPWAILKGLDQTGVTFFQMDEGVDTGPVLDQFVIPLEKDETADRLYGKVNEAHVLLMRQILPKLQTDTLRGIRQDETTATYWEGRKPEDGELSLQMTCEEADRLIRATTRPYPGAFIYLNGIKYIIWSGRVGSDGDFVLRFSDSEYSVIDYSMTSN